MHSLVSIILPVYNGEKFLAQSIQSVIKQTYKNWELIIVDDCSTDNSNKIAQEFANLDNRIRVIKNDKNLKLPESLNVGFKEASGEYLTWTSDDNEYYPEAISKMVDFLENNSHYSMVYAICEKFDEFDNPQGLWGEIPASAQALLGLNVIGACFLYRKEIKTKIGEYDKSYFLAEDHNYWLRIKLNYQIANLEEILYKYRIHSKSLSAKSWQKAHLISIKLAVKYYQEYYQKFPYLKKIFNNDFALQEALVFKNEIAYEKIKKDYTKKYLYQELKKFFMLTKDSFYIKQMMKFGFKYFIKALLLELKTRRVEE